MNRKIDTELKIKTILEKVENKLRLIAKDPEVISYNYYNDSKFVGAKVMRNKKITLEQLAAKFDKFADVVMVKLDKLEDFAVKQLAFNETQLAFNKKIESLPTISKELKELEDKDKK